MTCATPASTGPVVAALMLALALPAWPSPPTRDLPGTAKQGTSVRGPVSPVTTKLKRRVWHVKGEASLTQPWAVAHTCFPVARLACF